MDYYKKQNDGISLLIKVIPRSSKNSFEGVSGGRIKIKLAAPAIAGRANEALIEFLADFFALKKSLVSILSGALSRHKIVKVSGLSEEKLFSMLRGRGIDEKSK